MTLVDSNILIDIFGRDPTWWEWSLSRLTDALVRGPIVINDVIYAETSIRFQRLQEFDERLRQDGVDIVAIPHEALFMAGKVFTQYRRAKGEKTGVLPDFFIGAHAAVAGLPLLTRDAKRYRRYFPTIDLIAPDGA